MALIVRSLSLTGCWLHGWVHFLVIPELHAKIQALCYVRETLEGACSLPLLNPPGVACLWDKGLLANLALQVPVKDPSPEGSWK